MSSRVNRVIWLCLAVISAGAALFIWGMLVNHVIEKDFVLSRLFHPWAPLMLGAIMIFQTIMCWKISRE